ncbi:MAG: APC family permease [Acidimicrobiales bacterium]
MSDVKETVIETGGLKRDVGFFGLLWASEGSIIGSGWLFAGLLATEIAGPSALISWGIASIIVILLALVHAELGGMFAVTGGTSRYPHYAYGSLAGASFGWFAYLQAASVAPIEVLATLQYTSGSTWAASFAKNWYKSNNTLSGSGILVAICLIVVFVIVNLIGIRWLANSNSGITTWKIVIPLLAVVVFLTKFHGGNFSHGGGFFTPGPDGGAHAILDAIPDAGIVFSLLGFEQAVQLGGEARNPKKDLPRAVIFSILIGAAVYILAQFAFIAALSPATLAHYHTWTNLGADTGLSAAPFYTVAKIAGLSWLAYILSIDAVVSPAGTGLIYLTSASRIGYGLSKNGYIPTAFEKTTPRTRIPAIGVIITSILGLLFLLPFPSWSKLVGVVTSASVLMYASAPLALGALRKSKPNMMKPYALPAGKYLIPLSFILANLIVYWAGWGTYTTLMVALIIGYLLIWVSYTFKLNPNQPKIDWGAAKWLFPYFIGMGVISFFGSFGTSGIIGGIGKLSTVWVGGDGRLPLWWDILVVAIFSLIIYYFAIENRLKDEEIDQYISTVVVHPDPAQEL